MFYNQIIQHCVKAPESDGCYAGVDFMLRLLIGWSNAVIIVLSTLISVGSVRLVTAFFFSFFFFSICFL